MSNLTLIKTILRNSIAEGIYKEITNRSARYFYTLGKTLQWDDELSPVIPVDSIAYERSTRNEMITVKEISPADVSFVVPSYEWKSGMQCDQYDDQYSTEIQGINLKSSGSEYPHPPVIYIGSNGSIPFTANTLYVGGQLLYFGENFYLTVSGGTSSSTVVPSHTTGTVVNGTVPLKYVVVIQGGGSGATATAYLTDRAITNIEITNRGIGYTSVPSVIIGGVLNATDATASAVIVKGPKSKNQKIEDCQYFVVTDDHNVYICLDNNNNAFSTYKPDDIGVSAIAYPDGYIWKFMYTIPIGLRNKFATLAYIPVTSSIQTQFYTNGNIQAAKIDKAGTGYTYGEISVTGDGYLELNPVYLDSIGILAAGAGYMNPTISIDPPFANVTAWTSEQVVVSGQKISYQDNIYQVVISGKFNTVGPTHTYNIVDNGTAALKYVGTNAKANIFVRTLSGVQITGTGGQFSCTATTLAIGNQIAISGTYGGTGSIVGYANPTTYKISATNGTTTFTLLTLEDDAVVTTTGTPTGLTYTGKEIYNIQLLQNIRDISMTNGGSGYDTTLIPPTVSITGDGTGATATAIMEFGVVTRIIITNYGKNYITVPTIKIGTEWAASTSVAATSQIFYGDNLYTVTSAGTTHASLPPIGGSVITAAGNFVIGQQYTILSVGTSNFMAIGAASNAVGIIFTASGAGDPLTTGTARPSFANGTATLTYAGDAAKAICTLKCGAGYSVQPNVSISGVSGSNAVAEFSIIKSEAQLIPIIQDGRLVDVQIDDGGIGYTYAILTMTGDGTDAELSAQLSLGDASTLQSNIELLAVDGAIHNIPVISGGYGYLENTLIPTNTTVVITGDGVGATAIVPIEVGGVPGISAGAINKIQVTNIGSGYTWATATIVGAGTGAKLRTIIAPYGGFGREALNNLCARTLMFYSNISIEKNQGFVVNNDYRQIGILKNPRQHGSTYTLTTANASACWVISSTTTLDIGLYPIDSIVYVNYGSSNPGRFRIVSHSDAGSAILVQSLDNIPVTINSIIRNDSASFVVSTVTEPTIDKYSGDFLFIDNKQAFSPSTEQIVSLRTVLKF